MADIPLAETSIAIIIIALLLGAVLASSSSGRDGVFSWSMAFFWHAGTYAVLLLCPAKWSAQGLFLATLCYTIGSACLMRGVAKFVGRPIESWALWLPSLIVLLTAPFIDLWPSVRVLLRGLILAGQLVFLLWFLARNHRDLPGSGKYWLTFALAVIVSILVTRVGYASTHGVEGWAMLSLMGGPTPDQIGYGKIAGLAIAIALPVMIGTSSLVIVKDRLRQKSIDTQEFVQKVFDSIPHQFCVIDKTGEIVTVNRAWSNFAAENAGDPASIGVGMNYLNVLSGGDRRIEDGIRAVLEHQANHFSTEYPRHGTDNRHWFLMQVAPLNDSLERAVISHTEITVQKELELLREQNLTLFRDIANSVPGILYRVREAAGQKGKPIFDFMSPRVGELGLDAQAVMQDSDLFLSLVHPEDRDETVSSVSRSAAARTAWQTEFRLRQRDGSYRWYQGRAVPEPEGKDGDVVWYGHFQDIQDRKDADERIRYMAQMDSLTGLPNRYLFDDRLRQAVAAARRDGHKFALLFIDLDRFKPVNDQYGHDVGDLLLREVADRLRHCLREVDTPARIGGDEFVVLLHRVNGEDDVGSVASKISARLAEPYAIRGEYLRISSSVGISIFPDDGDDPVALVACADRAMYQVKRGMHKKSQSFNAQWM